jgi:hypothetical protein
MKNKILLFLFIIIFSGAVYLFFVNKKIAPHEADFFVAENKDIASRSDILKIEPALEKNIKEENVIKEKEVEEAKKDIIKEDVKIIEEKPEPVGVLKINFLVPFTSQAPFGEWDNPIFQDGCEEASSLMAISWARGEALNPEKAKTEIMAAADYEKENYGEFRDTSAADTLERIVKGYFKYEKAEVKNNISADNIISELKNGNLVILLMNGQLLDNPYYTPPGPDRHNIVVIGYDEETGEFITNDPGTKHGAGFRYNKDILFKAIRDYPTGYHKSIERIEKNMIIVSK